MTTNALLKDILRAIREEEDPKKLTQEQIKRLVKRVEAVANIHLEALRRAADEATNEIPGARRTYRYENSKKIEYSEYNENHAAVSLLYEMLQKEAFQDKFMRAVNEELKNRLFKNTASYGDSISISASSLLPKGALSARRKKLKAEFSKVHRQLYKAQQKVRKDHDDIIDAAVFYKSEHIIDVLDAFENKEYTL